jgi:peptidoglycan/xylan/chitin deacetylase (PgdA/CDA1 family)
VTTTPHRPGAFVISLDFELRWGVRDHCPSGDPYERNLHGARATIPRMLELFERFGAAATWATVGLLFAQSQDEVDHFRPAILPSYRDPALFPYDQPVGSDEEEDPLHFAPSLVDRIAATPRQELATHTYSHYFCTEAGQTVEQFRADMEAARAIAASRGIVLRSIVFPRNQHNPSYDGVLRDSGIIAYRGNPHGWMWRFADAAESAGSLRRALRLADAYLGITGDGSFGWDDVAQPSGLADVRASFLLRPYSPALRHLEPLRLRRLRGAIRSAARRNRLVHLWWHPHNFGLYPAESLGFLERVLEEFRRCREEYGMESLTMADVAEHAGCTAAPAAMTPQPVEHG